MSDSPARYMLLQNIADIDIPRQGILSVTPYDDPQVRVVVFGFATGEELSEHTASMPAILHIVQGEAHLTLGEDAFDAQAGTWVHMPARLPHSVAAKTPLIMALYLLKENHPD